MTTTKPKPYRDPVTGRFAKRPTPAPVAQPPRRRRPWALLALLFVPLVAAAVVTLVAPPVDAAAVVAKCTRSADSWTVEAARRTALTGRRHTPDSLRADCRLAATAR